MNLTTALIVISDDMKNSNVSVAYAYSQKTKRFTVMIEANGHIFTCTDDHFTMAYATAVAMAKEAT